MTSVLILLAWLATAGVPSGKGEHQPSGDRGSQAPDDSSLIKQDITIKGKSGPGPGLEVPGPAPQRAVLAEVVDSLEIAGSSHGPGIHRISLGALKKRLARPFPSSPYLAVSPRPDRNFNLWRFEILSAGEPIWHTTGEGRVGGTLEWDGTGASGSVAIRVGRPYRMKFTASWGRERYHLESEDVILASVAYLETLGGRHLEVELSRVFEGKTSKLAAGAEEFLELMAESLRRVEVGQNSYRIMLRQDPSAKGVADRVRVLRRYFANKLVISPKRVAIEVESPRERGETIDCPIP